MSDVLDIFARVSISMKRDKAKRAQQWPCEVLWLLSAWLSALRFNPLWLLVQDMAKSGPDEAMENAA